MYIRPVGETEAAALMRAKDYTGAKAAYEAALKQRPNSGFGLYGLARVKEAQGDAAGAREAYVAFLKAWASADAGFAGGVARQAGSVGREPGGAVRACGTKRRVCGNSPRTLAGRLLFGYFNLMWAEFFAVILKRVTGYFLSGHGRISAMATRDRSKFFG